MRALKVSGNRIVDAVTLAPVTLRGVVRSGLEYSGPAGAISAEEIDRIVTGWGANILRLPFNQDWAMARPGYDPEPYLASIDAVIQAASTLGAYTLLDLQWLDAITPRGAGNFVAPLPNLESGELWRQLARRYAGENAVLFDIFNEPHDAMPGDPVPLLGIWDDGTTFPLASRKVSMKEWQPWAKYLIAAIRSEKPDALIFVPGIDWAYDLTGFPIEGIEDVVYSTHVYRGKGDFRQAAFGPLASRVAVFAGEWGGTDNDLNWGRELAQYFDARQVGWTAWSWCDKPYLIEPPGAPDYRPTAFGELVRDSLASGGI